jgi:phage gpG-like protein
MLAMIADNFEEEGWPRYSWDPLKHREGKPLQDTRQLFLSYFPGNTGTVTEIDELGGNVVVGSNLQAPGGEHSLAAIHEFGAPKANIPARSVATWREDRARNCAEILADALVENL